MKELLRILWMVIVTICVWTVSVILAIVHAIRRLNLMIAKTLLENL